MDAMNNFVSPESPISQWINSQLIPSSPSRRVRPLLCEICEIPAECCETSHANEEGGYADKVLAQTSVLVVQRHQTPDDKADPNRNRLDKFACSEFTMANRTDSLAINSRAGVWKFLDENTKQVRR